MAAGAPALRAQPFIYHRGVVNAASFTPPGLPNAPIARGSIFTVFGRNLGPGTGVAVTAFPLSETLAGVSLGVCQAGSCLAAIPLYVSSSQINAILPSETPVGRVAVRVTVEGAPGNFAPIDVAEHNVGVFTARGSGYGPGIVQNFISQGEQPLNTNQISAAPGQVVTLWGTGLGAALNSDRDAPQAGSLPTAVEVFVGGVQVEKILYSGRSPCCAGVDQIVFEIPPTAPSGCWVPVHVRTGGKTVSNSVTIAVGSSGGCSDAHNPFQRAMTGGGRIAAFFVDRLTTHADIDPDPATTYDHEAAALMLREEQAGAFVFDRKLSWPPIGSCTAYGIRGDYLRAVTPPWEPSGRWLDGGAAATVRTGSESASLTPSASQPGFLRTAIAGFQTAIGSILSSATAVEVQSAGGAEVGAVSGSVPVGDVPVWTNREQTRTLTRGAPVTVEWEPPNQPDRLVAITAAAVDQPHNVSGLLLCIAPAADGRFTVPGWATANLPPTRKRLWEADAVMGIGMGAPGGLGTLEALGVGTRISQSIGWTASTIQVQETQP